MEMTCVGESQVRSDRCDVRARSQPPLRFDQPQMQMVTMERQSVGLLELPRQLKSTHRNHGCQLIETHVFVHVLQQVILRACQSADVQPAAASCAAVVSYIEASEGSIEHFGRGKRIGMDAHRLPGGIELASEHGLSQKTRIP